MAQIGFRGERLDLVARQGASLGPYVVTLENPNGTPVDLTGCTIQGQVRKNALDTGAPVATFVIVYVDRMNGKFSFEIPHAETAAIPAGEFQKDDASLYEWDMELLDSQNRITPIFYGVYENFREVTRV